MAIDTVGWTLIHFIWQGAVIGVLFGAALLLCRTDCGERGSHRRYSIALTALALTILCPVLTFTYLVSGHNAGVADAPRLMAAIAWSQASLGQATDWTARVESSLPYLVWIWGAGVMFGSARLAISWFCLYLLRHSGVEPTPLWLERELHRLQRKQDVPVSVRLGVSNAVRVPVTAGWIQPVILFPACAISGLSMDQVRLVLAHELEHIRRHDYLVNWLQNFVQVVLFYHPVVHWVAAVLNDERELCCDHRAIATTGDRLAYARTLLRLQEVRSPRMAMPMSSSYRLLFRIQRLLGQHQHQGRSSAPIGWLVGAVLTTSVALMSGLVAPATDARPAAAGTPVVASRDASVDAAPMPHPLAGLPERVAGRIERLAALQQTSDSSPEAPGDAVRTRGKQGGGVLAGDPGQHRDAVASAGVEERPRRGGWAAADPGTMIEQMRAELNRVDRGEAFDARQLASELLGASGGIGYQDEAPAPGGGAGGEVLRIVNQVTPGFPGRLSGMGIEVSVNVIYSVTPAGMVRDIQVLTDDVHADFQRAVVAALRQWRFAPRGPRSQTVHLLQTFDFVQPGGDSRCTRVTGSNICGNHRPGVEIIHVNANPPDSNSRSRS